MKLKNVLLAGLSFVLVAAIAIGGTLAYLTSEDSDVNVMTLGNVEIQQIEKERVFDANGNVIGMQDFTQAQTLFPAVVTNGSGNAAWQPNAAVDLWYKDYLGDRYPGGNGTWQNLNNVMDKFVFVENTGKSDAYYRTIILLEADETATKNAAGQYLIHLNVNGRSNFVWEGGSDITDATPIVEVNGEKYWVKVVTNTEILEAGTIARPSLLQVGMDQLATNEYVAQFGNTYDILVLSQAVQVAGFASAEEALTTSFGAVTEANVIAWFSGDEFEVPSVTLHEDVLYYAEGNTATVSSRGGDTMYRGVYSDGPSTVTEVIIEEGIERLNNRALCKNMNLTSVSLPNSLTYIDEGAFQQSGFVTIEVPENVTYIGKTAFGACPNLETIIIKAKNVTFANYVGRDSRALKEVYIYSDTVTFESGGSMYFTNTQSGDASNITFYVANQDVADALYNSSAATRSYGMLIKSIDGSTIYYNTLP